MKTIITEMKIGFDISQTGKYKAGCGYLADSLIAALTEIDHENEYLLYPHFGSLFWDPDGLNTTRVISQANVSRKIIGKTFDETMSFWNAFPTDGESRLGHPDIIHANNFFCPIGIKKAKIVYTLYDAAFLDHPEFTTEQNRWVCFNGVFNAANHADFIISISRYSRDRFLNFFPHFPPERIKIAYLGSRFDAQSPKDAGCAEKFGLTSDQFWLTACTLEPRKNLRQLLRAFAVFTETQKSSYPLVLAGGKGWMEDDIEAFIGNLKLTEKVIMTGYISDAELAWLYGNCRAFVYPSLYEGFGLPVLEAMSLGAAVIASNAASIPEVAGKAAHYIDPVQQDEITAAFVKLTDDDYSQRLKLQATHQASKFSWRKCALEVLAVYKQVINL